MSLTVNNMHLVGGALAFDFANTKGDGVERLNSVDDVVHWMGRVNLHFSSDGVAPAETGGQRTKSSEDLLDRVRRTRDSIRMVGNAVSRGEMPSNLTIHELTTKLSLALSTAEFAMESGGSFRWNFSSSLIDNALLGPVLISLFDLLCAGDLDRVKSCPLCGFLFHDVSKNNSRKWCSMSTCGNRSKVAKFRGSAQS